jgi:hypothetical protein
MTKSNKIVRVRKIHRTDEDKSRWHYDDYLAFFKDAMIDTSYIGYGGNTKLYPYKWYELQWLWTHPSFLLLSYLYIRFDITLKKNMTITMITYSIIFITESLVAWFIVQIFKKLINIQSDLG